jgi:cytochrome b
MGWAMSGIRRGGSRQTVLRLSMRVWDLPTRLFHWAIVALVATSYVTTQLDDIQLHLLSGYTILALLLFRLAWGFVGSDTSRFGRFVKSPVAAFRHLAAFPKREPDDEIGHNAAGGWMVLVMLLLLAVQVGTGLFSNDDVVTQGPLAQFVSKAVSDRITGYHALNFNILLGAIGLHVVAIAAYAAVKRQNLLRPMITGRKRLPGSTRQPRMASPVLAAALVALAACLVWVLATRV